MTLPLDWQGLVAEAIRRRREEKLTQRAHAALANVSVPTIVAFDRGDHSLTLAKAFDILRVVGLVDEHPELGEQERFVENAAARWRQLIEKLPADSPGRFSNGWWRIDYALEGEHRPISVKDLAAIMRRAIARHPGSQVFRVPGWDKLAPYEADGVLECWIPPGGAVDDRLVRDAAYGDFWRAAPTGRLVVIRGYLEDTQEMFAPGSILDTTLPIWRLGEALLHAAGLAAELRQDAAANITIRFRALYTGLRGRVLRAWTNPLSDLLVQGHAARSDEALLEAAVPAHDVPANLAHHLFPLIASLYERFGVAGLSERGVEAVVERLLTTRRQSLGDSGRKAGR